MNNINYNNVFVIIFLAGTAAGFILNHFMEFIDWRARCRNGGRLPEELSDIPASACFDTKKLADICSYENAKYFAWIPESICSVILTIALVCTGFYPWLFNIVCRFAGIPAGFGSTYLCALLFFILASLPSSIISIPFQLHSEFVIEKKFGFSKMTLRLWLSDSLKNTVLSLIMSAVLIAAMAGILMLFPDAWWLVLACVMIVFSLIIQVIYPLIIAPMFNKFTALEDGELKSRITALMQKTGFKANGIFVMDASKRSGHSNAYFGGMGKSKRIVLYDTLIKQMNAEELEGVLGHELGHYKLHHIIKRFCIVLPVEIILLYILYRCAQLPSLYTGFGFTAAPEMIQPLQFIGLFLSSLFTGPLTEIFSPLINSGSRRDEYAADKFSATLTGNPDALISGLVKLNSENLSELFPPRLYVIWNYSHPTLTERIKALKSLKK